MYRTFLTLATSSMLLTSGMSLAAETTRIIVPSTAGGTQDRIARLLAEGLGEQLGETFVVENRPGGGGVIGSQEVASAGPDGHTLGVVFDSHATNQFLYDVPYDTFSSFDHVSLLVSAPHVLATSSELPYNTLDDLVAAARNSPGEITYGAIGAGSTTLSAIILAQNAGIEVTPVNYSGGGGAYATDLLAGRFDYVMSSLPAALAYIRDGRLKALAYGGETPTAILTDVPTLGATFPGMTAASWVGLIAPAGLPQERLALLNEAVVDVLTSAEVRSSLEGEGFIIEASTPEEFLTRVRRDAEELGPLIRSQSLGR